MEGETGGVQAGAEGRVRRGAVLEMWKGNEGYVRAGGMMRKGEIAGIWGGGGMRLGMVDEEES